MKGILKPISIIFIIFACLGAVLAILAIAGGGVLAAAGDPTGGVIAGFAIILGVIALLGAVFQFLTGLFGLKGAKGDAGKLKAAIILAIISIAISVISMILGAINGAFDWTSLVSFILPILFIASAFAVKKDLGA